MTKRKTKLHVRDKRDMDMLDMLDPGNPPITHNVFSQSYRRRALLALGVLTKHQEAIVWCGGML